MINFIFYLKVVANGCLLVAFMFYLVGLSVRKTDKADYIFMCCYCCNWFMLGVIGNAISNLILFIFNSIDTWTL